MFRETYSLSIIIALFFLFQGCKRVKHEVNTTYSTDIIATEISLKTDGYLFGGSAILDPNLNDDVTSSWEIVAVDVDKVQLKIIEASSYDMLFSYFLEITITNNVTGKSITHSFDEINSLHPDNDSFLIPDSAENIAFFTELLKERHTATVDISGYSSQTAVILLFNFKIKALVGLG